MAKKSNKGLLPKDYQDGGWSNAEAVRNPEDKTRQSKRVVSGKDAEEEEKSKRVLTPEKKETNETGKETK